MMSIAARLRFLMATKRRAGRGEIFARWRYHSNLINHSEAIGQSEKLTENGSKPTFGGRWVGGWVSGWLGDWLAFWLICWWLGY